MENFVKVERLRKAANISFEEARMALEKNNWDLLDAIVSLEKEGKTTAANVSYQSTDYQEMPQLPSVQEVIDENKRNYDEKADMKQEVRRWARIAFDFIRFNSFSILKDEEIIVKIPVWGCLIILAIAWHVVLIGMVIGLFFGLRYSFSGKDDMTIANDIMDEAGNLAEKAKEQFKK